MADISVLFFKACATFFLFQFHLVQKNEQNDNLTLYHILSFHTVRTSNINLCIVAFNPRLNFLEKKICEIATHRQLFVPFFCVLQSCFQSLSNLLREKICEISTHRLLFVSFFLSPLGDLEMDLSGDIPIPIHYGLRVEIEGT